VCGPQGKITLEKQWSRIPQPYALQTTRKDILIHDPSFAQYRTLDQLYPNGSSCFMLGQPNYGCQGEVLQVSKEHKGRVQIGFFETKEPDISPVFRVKDELAVRYYPGYRCAQMLGISPHILSRITGSIFVSKSPKEADSDRMSRVNVGLNLKLNKRNEEVAGYTQKRTTENNSWFYSDKAVNEIADYMRMFPGQMICTFILFYSGFITLSLFTSDLFQYLGTSGNASKDMFHVEDIWLDFEKGCDRLKELASW
jgi:5'-3' exoribonuclease 1